MKTISIHAKEINDEFLTYGEWLVTNGIGGFACGSIGGTPMRKYHSYLNASLPAPYGRTNMLNYIQEEIFINNKWFPLNTCHYKDTKPSKHNFLIEFHLENGIPYWKYDVEGIIFEKSLLLIHGQNTLCLTYKILTGKETMQLRWTPFFHFNTNDQEVSHVIPNETYTVTEEDFRYEINCPSFPSLKIFNEQHFPFIQNPQELSKVYYEIEEKRGYPSLCNLNSPGYFTISLEGSKKTSFFISTESWKNILSIPSQDAYKLENIRKKSLLKAANASDSLLSEAQLVIAADQFIFSPNNRYEDILRMKAAGEQLQSIIAGFPWFNDWGRDTMISLEGLTLSTGRFREAYAILTTFSHYITDGLIPNYFPDGATSGKYHSADASLWFFHAVDRYLHYTKDEDLLEILLPKLTEIIQFHTKGTHFGIKVDEEDGLLVQKCEGYQLTWMDAKVGDWVVTPRRGKAVEICALWYNALRLYEEWTGKSLPFTGKCYDSFNKKFWFSEGKYLYDVIEGDQGNDPSLRPNQLYAISLKYPVLEKKHWQDVVKSVESHLLTPFGLRTLSPTDLNYRPYYEGDVFARDAAYHQGTIWPFLMGVFVDAFLKAFPQEHVKTSTFLQSLEEQLNGDCMGTIAEIFDATSPYHARGCFAQAWSVAELLRVLKKIRSFAE